MDMCTDSERYVPSPVYTNSKCQSQDLKASSDCLAKILQDILSWVSWARSWEAKKKEELKESQEAFLKQN